jgi:membrane dipeptidase
MDFEFSLADMHCDTALSVAAGNDLDDATLQVNLPDMKRAGMGLQVFALYVPPAIPHGHRIDFVKRVLQRFQENLDLHSSEIQLCTTAGDIRAAREQNKIAALLSVENGNAIEDDLDNLQVLYDMGVRLMTLVHARSNDWIVSSADASPAFDGLTDFGLEVVDTMNELGMIIDLSHAHDSAVEAVLGRSSAPVTASHSCAYSLCPVSRNLKDDYIEEISRREGVVGVNLYPGFLDLDYFQYARNHAGDLFAELSRMEDRAGPNLRELAYLSEQFRKQFQQAVGPSGVSLERFADHVEYIVRLVGDQSVAFGFDLDGVPQLPDGIRSCAQLGVLPDVLASRGLSREQVFRISWDNVVRLFETVCG